VTFFFARARHEMPSGGVWRLLLRQNISHNIRRGLLRLPYTLGSAERPSGSIDDRENDAILLI
jgi:hypothetical protein